MDKKRRRFTGTNIASRSIISNDLVDVVAPNSDTEEELDEIEEFEESTGVDNEDESIF